MLSKRLAAVLGIGAIVLAGCGEGLSTAPDELSEEDRAEIIELLKESGFFSDDFGVDGTVEDEESVAVGAPSSAPAVALNSGDVTPPRFWGRRRGQPVRRTITVDVDHETGTATVTKEVVFDGKFVLDITQDGQFNPTEKPLQETLVHTALFRRIAEDAANVEGRRWRLVRISPAQWVMTDEEKRTVNIDSVGVWVNGEHVWTVTDPSEFADVETRLPRLLRGDTVLVRAAVSNTLDSGNDPDTFVFLHLLHAKRNVRAWARLPMARVVGDEGVYYERRWVARHSGRARAAVDAIDAQTFATESEDDYRANIWGVPYRIVVPSVDAAGG